MARGEFLCPDGICRILTMTFSLFGRLAAGWGADKIGRWNMFIIACTISGICEFAVWIPASEASIDIGFAIMFGFASGAFMALSGALPVSVSPLPEIGYRLGVVFLAISIPALTMAPVDGAILQASATHGWRDVKIFGGVMCIAESSIVLLSSLLYTKKKLLKVSWRFISQACRDQDTVEGKQWNRMLDLALCVVQIHVAGALVSRKSFCWLLKLK